MTLKLELLRLNCIILQNLFNSWNAMDVVFANAVHVFVVRAILRKKLIQEKHVKFVRSVATISI